MTQIPTPHESERISALLDGTLDSGERTEVEAHLASCAECRATESALRATVADLADLPPASFSPSDAWAIRSAIRRQRRGTLIGRLAPALAGVAAALVAVLAVTMDGSPQRDVSGALQAESSDGLGAVSFIVTDDDYTPEAARERLLAVTAGTVVADAPMAPVPATRGTFSSGGESADDFSATSGGGKANLSHVPEFDAAHGCAETLRSSSREELVPVLYEAARFGGRPAFLIALESPERWELWVVARADCSTLFFTQKRR